MVTLYCWMSKFWWCNVISRCIRFTRFQLQSLHWKIRNIGTYKKRGNLWVGISYQIARCQNIGSIPIINNNKKYMLFESRLSASLNRKLVLMISNLYFFQHCIWKNAAFLQSLIKFLAWYNVLHQYHLGAFHYILKVWFRKPGSPIHYAFSDCWLSFNMSKMHE